MSLLHVCPATGCRKLIPVNQKYCEKHAVIAEQKESQRQKRYDSSVRLTRDKQYHEFYLSSGWKLTKQKINSHYHGMCLWAWAQGRIEHADEVHHIVPLKDDWDRRYELSNLIPIAHSVHMKVEAAYRSGHKEEMQKILFEILKKWETEYPGGIKKV